MCWAQKGANDASTRGRNAANEHEFGPKGKMEGFVQVRRRVGTYYLNQ